MELVIAEKPSVAQSIAAVLGATQRKDGYLEGNDYLVSWCVGHLVELVQPESYEEAWKKWSYDNLPIIPQEWQHEVKSDTKAQYQILKKLMHDDRVDAVVCATDAGREGELIFRLTYNMAGCRKPMKRLWISSMEESAIRDGFHNLRPGSDYDNLYKSALCRQEADWLVGINGTRLFTVLYGGKALKVGRVQTPTLAMLVDRESKIMNFKKEAYYMAYIMGNGLDAVSEHISDKTEAERIAGACENGQALVTSVIKEEKWVAPPKLYDLTTLQRDANRLFGFTAKQTLEYTQSLYEKKLVTYPRTDSQYLSDDMEGTAKNVIEAIFNSLLFEQNVMFNPDIKRILNSKKVTDHHAIIPTMEIIKQDLKAIPESEMKILSLCANRLLCATGEKHIYNSTKAEITCNNIVFKVSGKEVWKNGWKEFEDFFKNSYKTTEDKSDAEEEKKLPELREGMTIAVEQTKVSEHFTQPPKHYTEDSLLSAMERAGNEDMSDDVERKGLGTPATRADIIEKLVKDGFVKREKKQMIPTEDGMKLITILPDVVKSPKLTADWENELTLVSKGEVAAEQFMSGIEAMVTDLVKTYHSVSDEHKAIYIAGIQVDINPITEGRTGTLETYLPEVETYLQEKAQQEQINNQLVTQGRELVQEQNALVSEEKVLSELEKEPVIEPETVHITFTVAECGEFHNMGEYHEGIETIEEAMKLYNAIDPSRMHGIPSIGVNMHIEGTEEWEDEQADIVSGKRIDVDFLNYTPELRDTPTVQDALKKLIAAYPEKEVNDRETKETKIQTLAAELDKLSYEIDTYGYRDSVSDRESQIQMIADDIRTGNVKPLSIFLQASIDEGIDEDSERQAKELLVKLAEYKPLAKIEELEEQNYNMIDERLNNGVEKFNREEEKKEQAEKPQVRTSLKERLAAKQKEVAQGKKDSKEQEKSKNTHREM